MTRTAQPHKLPGLDNPVSSLPGIGPKRATALAERGLRTVRDLLFHLPSHFRDWRIVTPIRQLEAGKLVTIRGEFKNLKQRPIRGNRWRVMVEAEIRDGNGDRAHLLWFNLPTYARESLPVGQQVLAHGSVSAAPEGGVQLVHPELFSLSNDAQPPAVRPFYSLPEMIPQRLYAKMVREMLAANLEQIQDAIPGQLRTEIGVVSVGQALNSLHNPDEDSDVAALEGGSSEGHRTLALHEMFAFQLSLCLERQRAARRSGLALLAKTQLPTRFLNELPFALTASQQRAANEIVLDMAKSEQMNRLLMGDVGSGKTVVALFAALTCVEAGYQAALMAPTELLAEQHFRTFQKLCANLGVSASLLTGALQKSARTSLLKRIRGGDISLVFGTQALIQSEVQFPNLGLAIIDEQHRFGVFDRARLKDLGPAADMLLMTATPIPRSLAMVMFSNLSISSLEEMPSGRVAISTRVLELDRLPEVHDLVLSEVKGGHRAYYVLPKIDTDEEGALSVTGFADKLCAELGSAIRIGTIHGRLPPAEKERVMREFRDGELDVLVATTVIEVGIDVAEATVMVVMAAERYGLAQLHQLRGRVGRGTDASHCVLVISTDAESSSRRRAEVLARSARGADIAKADLDMRGPGDLFGARQTGPLPLRFMEFLPDFSAVERCRNWAEQWIKRDPALRTPESNGARQAVRQMLEFGFSLADVG